MVFSADETAACQHLVELAFAEDLGPASVTMDERPGDVTSKSFIPTDLTGRAVFVAKAAGVVAGLPAVELALQTAHTPLLKLEALVTDGTRVEPGTRLAVVTGIMEFILTAERTALNFLQHLSGVATLTRKFVDAIEGLPCKIYDTRKTTPGWRLLEKYAVRWGGGHNHRMGLYDAILIKDNHLAALPGTDELRRIEHAVHRARETRPGIQIEIEVDSLTQFWIALDCRPDVILLDNMRTGEIQEAVSGRNAECEPDERVLVEASGGVTLDTVRAIAETGVDRISVGAITHSAQALDIALDIET